MSSSFLALLFGLFLLPTSMAIKCISQPDHEEAMNFDKQFPTLQAHDPVKYKPAFLRMLNTSGKVDCTKIAREYGLAKPTHCVSTVDLSTCTGRLRTYRTYAMFEGVAPKELQGIKLKGCHFEQATGQTAISNIEWATGNTCYAHEEYGCGKCQVCNERNFCNGDTKMGTTGGTTEVTEKPKENGAGLPNGGAPQALFLLLLAIATGAFRRAAFC